MTRVENDQIRFVRHLYGQKSERRQDLIHARRIIDIHLTTERLYKDASCQPRRPPACECSIRHQAASLDASAGKFRRDATGSGGLGIDCGRPKSAAVKEQISVRLDPDVIAKLREAGPRWQSRLNDLLRAALGLPKGGKRAA